MPLSIHNITNLALEITSHCNIRCPQCSRTHPMGGLADFIRLQHWNMDVIIPNLELEHMQALKHVRIEGDNGDAFMHPNVIQLLDAIVSAPSEPTIQMLTNGGMRSTQWWKDLGQRYRGRLQVQFSIDGLADTNPLYRVDINHKKVIANARAFLEGGGDGTQRCLIFKHNQHQIQDIIKQARDIGMNALKFIPNDSTRFQDLNVWPVYSRDFEITHVIENTSLQDLSAFGYNNSQVKFKFGSVIHDEICPEWKAGSVAITYMGHIIPCCAYHADLYFDHPSNTRFKNLVGDINDIDLNLHKLSTILDSQHWYGKRLTETIQSDDPLMRCQTTCPDVVAKNRTISILRRSQ